MSKKNGPTKAEDAKIRKQFGVKPGQTYRISDPDLQAFRSGKNVGISIEDAPVVIPRTEVSKLKYQPIKQLKSNGPRVEIIKVKVAPKPEPKPKFVAQPKVKRASSGGKPVAVQNAVTTVKNVVGKAKFEKEQRQKAAYERQSKGQGSTDKAEILRGMKEDKKVTKGRDARKEIRGAIAYGKKKK